MPFLVIIIIIIIIIIISIIIIIIIITITIIIIIINIIIIIIILLSTSVLPGWFLDCAGVWATLFLSLENKADGLVCLFELWLPQACVSSGRLDSLGNSGPFWSLPDVCCWAAVLVKLVREA